MLIYRNIFIISCLSFIFMGILYSQGLTNSGTSPRTGERYITDTEDGIIKMWVNVWGQVTRPGSYLVYDGIDLATLLSITGGPTQGANLSKIKLYRELPDANGNMSQNINLNKFLKSGDRGEFTRILPNDTYVIPQAPMSYFLSRLDIVNTFINFYNLYTIAKLREESTK